MINQSTIKEIADGILSFLKKNNLQEGLAQVIEYLQVNGEDDVLYVYSPRGLNEREKESIKKLLLKLEVALPKKIEFNKDASLIDGLKINYKDKMWDFSVKGQIGKITKI